MNSLKLKQKFPHIYQSFFQQSQKVVSAPHSFFWTGDFSGFYGGITVLSKLPLRFYVGLQQINQGECRIVKEFFAYSSQAKKFVKIKLDDYLVSKLYQLVGKELLGYQISFLSEITLGKSLGSLGALAACLAFLTNPEEPFLKGWYYAQQLQQGRTSGATTFAALSPSRYPVVFYSKGKKYWGTSLEEIFPLKTHPVWPIDFGLIFSGNLVQGAAVIANSQEIKAILSHRQRKIKKILPENVCTSFWDTYLNMLNQVAAQNLSAFGEIFQKGTKKESLEFFFNTLNQYQNLLHFLEISTPAIDQIYFQIHQIAPKTENQTGSGAKITGVGKGGEVLFAVPYGQYREKIIKFCQTHRKVLDYASWDDGFEQEGLILEQDISKNIIAPYVKKASLLLRIYQQNQIKTLLLSPAQVGKIAKEIDLLLSCAENKIYLKGKKLTSSSLPSQKAAITIMSQLLSRPQHILKNQELPSPYAHNRYDLQSKITLPLSRLLPLDFKIQGKTYDHYTLFLQPFYIKIGVLEKII
jgi:mevalonate kinase